MATSSTFGPSTVTGESDSDFLNYAIRMVVPMRREFGRSLDVPKLMHDDVYATEVIEQAKQSQDARLRDYAHYLDTKMLGPRSAANIAKALAASAPQADSKFSDSRVGRSSFFGRKSNFSHTSPPSNLPNSQLMNSQLHSQLNSQQHGAPPTNFPQSNLPTTGSPESRHGVELTEAELRARMMKKYKAGLR
jgi:hypothetical protein